MNKYTKKYAPFVVHCTKINDISKFLSHQYFPCASQTQAEKIIDNEKNNLTSNELLAINNGFDILKFCGIDNPGIHYISIITGKKIIISWDICMQEILELEINDLNNTRENFSKESF